jgi:polyvinyl alcohol dehydrogenase (cytochrome)
VRRASPLREHARFASAWKRWLGLALILPLAIVSAAQANAICGKVDPIAHSTSGYANGWGIDLHNTRYQPESMINADNAARLELKWTYGLASTAPRSYPLVTKDTIFVGDGGRGLVALDRETGCERWFLDHPGQISSAIVSGRIDDRSILIFNDRTQGVYAVDALTGKRIWHAVVEDEPLPWYSGTPLVTEEAVFVPVSSLEVAIAMNPLYGCCTSSGGMAAFDIRTGKKLWYLPTIQADAEITGSHWLFVSEYGPSGAAVWGAPSYDADLGWLFFGTGQNYSHPTTETSDAVFAVEAATGKIVWIQQFTQNDAYTAACNIVALNLPNCPDPHGPDVDFGAPTLLVQTNTGREIVIAGQKSADVHAMDRLTGERIWTEKLGRGGIIGGVHWGLAANENLGMVFVPISDKKVMGFPSPGEAAPGLYALDITTGSRIWNYTRASRCASQECVFGYSAAVTATNDVVVAGSMDGYLEVISATTGKLLWSHDAFREYPSVNDVVSYGGAFDAHGAMVADDLLIVSSGYAYVGEQRAGNALLVFQLESQHE